MNFDGIQFNLIRSDRYGGSNIDPNDWNINQMQGARYESGQDNSPLYDEGSQSLFNNVTVPNFD